MNIRNAYYDINDVENPIKYFYDTSITTKALNEFTRINDVFIKKVTYTINDNYLMSTQQRKGKFYKIGRVDKDIDDHKDAHIMAVFILSLDHQHESIETSVYTVVDLFGQLGGAFEIFEVVGKLLIGTYANKLFYHYAINWMHKQDELELESQKDKLDSSNEIIQKSEPQPAIHIGNLDNNHKKVEEEKMPTPTKINTPAQNPKEHTRK